MSALVPTSNTEAYRASTDAANICKEMVVTTAMTIQGRKYVKLEGWQAIAIAHGCTGSARDVERVEGGVRAVGEVRRMSDGQIIATGEGFVGEDEPTWFGGKMGNKTLPKRPDYAIRAMAQTRAISRACRSAFAHVVVMMNAGLQTTPAEEVPDGGFVDEPPMRDVTPAKATAKGEVITGRQLQEAQASGRKIPAQAKRDGDHDRYRSMIDNASEGELAELIASFDEWTATAPVKWLDSLRDRMELRHEELRGQQAVGADADDMDAAYRHTVAA